MAHVPDAIAGGKGIVNERTLPARSIRLPMPGERHRTAESSGGQSILRVSLGSLAQAAKERVPLATREGEIDVGNLGVPDQYLAALHSDLDTGTGITPGWLTPRKTIAHYLPPSGHFPG
jgi:hypothetical protein